MDKCSRVTFLGHPVQVVSITALVSRIDTVPLPVWQQFSTSIFVATCIEVLMPDGRWPQTCGMPNVIHLINVSACVLQSRLGKKQ